MTDINSLKSVPTLIRNALIREGITAVEQLEKLTDEEVLRLIGVGRRGLGFIKKAIGANGLTLGEQRRAREARPEE